MAWGEAFYRKATAKVEERTGETVDAIGWGSRGGALARVIATEAIDGAEAVLGTGSSALRTPTAHMLAPGGARGARLPLNFLVVLTASSLRLFGVRNSWRGVKLKREIGALPRARLTLEQREHGPVRRFYLHAPDGSGVVFDMARVKLTLAFAESLATSLA
jgi:hypothetical protein